MTIGFDLGGQNCCTAITKRNAKSISTNNFVDTVLDEGSNRLVAPFIGFPKKERVFGNNARKLGLKNSLGTISNPLRYLGKSFVEASSISTFSLVPIVPNPNPSKGGILTPAFKINYRGEIIFITPEHATALILKHTLRHIRKTNILSKECVISIPNNASYSYREALQTAAQIAQLEALKLSTSTENLATVQGLLERYSVKKNCVVLYLDLGHSGMNVGCVKFGEGGWEVISSDTFVDFSGELMDQKLVNYFINQFKKKHKEDLTTNPHSIAKILNVLPKLKKNLTINNEASFTVDFLFKNIDFSLKISREELYKQNQSSIESFLTWLNQFLILSKIRLGNNEITDVEAVGGVSRMYDLRLRLSKLLEKEIKINTIGSRLNTDEGVAKGAVLQCAILSPRYHFAKLNIKETIPWSICVAKENLVFQVNDWENCNYELLFPQHNELNKTKTITFKKPRSLSLLLVQNSNKTRQLIGVAQIDSINLKLEEGHNWKSFQIIIVLTKNGLLELRAQATKYHCEMIDVKKSEEILLTEKEITKDIQKIKNEAKKKMWVIWKNKKILLKLNRKEDKLLVSQSLMEIKIQKIKKTKIVEKLQKQEKKRYSKVTVPISFTTLTSLSLQTKELIMNTETEMSQFDNDCLVQLTARNDLETYVLNAQSEFSNGGIYFEFLTSKESENFINEIFTIDEWLNDDWEMNKVPSEYIERLTKVKAIGDCYVLRYDEWQKRPLLLEMLKEQIKQIEIWLKDERFNTQYKHITDEKVKELTIQLKDSSEWLSLKIQEHTNLVKTVQPPFFTEAISKRLEKSKLAFESIKNIPKSQSRKKKKNEKINEELEQKKDAQKKTKEGYETGTDDKKKC